MLYQIMVYGGFLLAGVLLILSVVLFFRLHIASVLGDLTGFTKRRQIEQLRRAGAKQEDNFYARAVGLPGDSGTIRPHSAKLERKSRSSRLGRKGQTQTAGLTPLPTAAPEQIREPAPDQNQTAALSEREEETAVLAERAEEETAVLMPEMEETSILTPEEGATTPLSQEAETGRLDGSTPALEETPEDFVILTQIVSVHSEETIGGRG